MSAAVWLLEYRLGKGGPAVGAGTRGGMESRFIFGVSVWLVTLRLVCMCLRACVYDLMAWDCEGVVHLTVPVEADWYLMST